MSDTLPPVDEQSNTDPGDLEDQVAIELTRSHRLRKPSVTMVPQADLSLVETDSDSSDETFVASDLQSQVNAINRSLGVVEFSLDGVILAVNENACRMFGFAEHELVGKHHRILVDPSEADSEAYRWFWRKLGLGEYNAGQYRRIGRGGREVWIQASYNPINDADGNPVKVIKYATDISTQQRRTADYEGQIAAISKSLAVIEFAMNGTVISANDNFLNMFGFGSHEVLGQHHKFFVDEQYAASQEYGLFWERLNRAEYHAGEYRHLGKGGRDIWIQASFNPIVDQSGTPLKVVTYATDITDEKINAAGFHGQVVAINRVSVVVEYSPEGIVLAANENFLTLFGYRLDEIKSKHQRMFLSTADRQKPEQDSFWLDLQKGEHKTGKMRYVAKDEEDVWLDANFTPVLDITGKMYKVVMYASDVTAQVDAELQAKAKGEEAEAALAKLRKAKDQLVQAEKLASLGSLVAGISHEVNTPLGIGVTAASHLQAEVTTMIERVETNQLKRSDLKNFMESCEEASAVILRNLERAADLIQSFKQVAVDQVSQEQRQFGVKKYLQEVVQSLGPKLKTTSHKITIECDDKLQLNSFPGALSQVISNLVVNSLTHAWDSGEKGEMKLTACADANKGIELTYSDNGRGIKEAEQKKVWDPFYTTARSKGGSGLGMSTIFNLLQKPLQGTIKLSSAEGKGVKFVMQLPPCSSAPEKPAPQSGAAKPIKRTTTKKAANTK